MRFIRRNWGLLLGLTLFLTVVIFGSIELIQNRDNQRPVTFSGTLAFQTDRDGNPEIYTWEITERKANRITNNGVVDANPAYSPDGRFIAFNTASDGQQDIFVGDAVTGVGTLVTNNPANDTYPVWSADGQRIAFVSDRGDTPSIFVMDRGGSNVIRVTGDEGVDSSPSWSGTADELVFSSDRSGTRDLYRLDVASCQPAEDGAVSVCTITSLTADAFNNFDPHFSPDGQQVAFVSDREGGQSLYLMSVRNNRITRLTEGTVDSNPKWSGEGGRLVFTSERDGNREIYIMDVARKQIERVTNNPAVDAQGAWRPEPPVVE
jgi:Tol biopolymer transport system component